SSPAADFSGSVLIIGAGAAGMSAGYLLKQAGVDFQILEAAGTYGGRMKRTTTFADFPIPLGAEWLHAAPNTLTKIVNDPSVGPTTELKSYSGREQVGYFEDGELRYYSLADAFGDDFNDHKFIDSTWFDFFDEYLFSHVRENIQLNTQIVSIDYRDDRITATDNKGASYQADRVVVAVPLKILQKNTIDFVPELPRPKLKAIQKAPIWGGLKVFLEFSKKFYPTYLGFPDSETKEGQRGYYDAAYGQKSVQHVLGLFAVGEPAKAYQRLSDRDQLEYILGELDQVFDGAASGAYVKHIVQNWDKEPFVESAYLADHAPSSVSSRLAASIDNKIYFAGDAYTQYDDWSGVHNAAQSARRVVGEILQTTDREHT
ncbi:MAG: NAD(P)/FAD-dependent oxidoreductase, partial [Verrucomicrobiota bacterium]